MLKGLLPAWVEADPLRSRATDPLGLQNVADRLADRLLPGLSVLTTRARYFSFFCWARGETGPGHNEHQIHRCEVALALTEKSLSDADPEHAESCRFVGSRNIKFFEQGQVPADPRRVYKMPAWRAYRPSLSAVGLVDSASDFSLTEAGAALSNAFRRAVRPRWEPARPFPAAACLSCSSHDEKRQLRDVLGLSIGGPLDADSADPRVRRSVFVREMRKTHRNDGLSPEVVLPGYEGLRSPNLPEPARTLRVAAVWERLSFGLNAVFVSWLRAVDAGTCRSFERTLAELLTGRLPQPTLEPTELSAQNQVPALARAVSSLRHAIRLHDQLDECHTMLKDEDAFELARSLVSSRQAPRVRVAKTINDLRSRHLAAKGDEAWVRECPDGELELARDGGETWKMPSVVRPHAYRMAAFHQIAFDLGGL